MEIDENPRKPEDQEVERGVWGGNRNLKGVAFSEALCASWGCGLLPKSSGYAEAPNEAPYTRSGVR